MPNGFEHLCDIIPKAQSWLVLNLPVFTFVYIQVRNVSDEKIYRHGTDTFVYVFAFINLVCVQSVVQLMTTPFITFLL